MYGLCWSGSEFTQFLTTESLGSSVTDQVTEIKKNPQTILLLVRWCPLLVKVRNYMQNWIIPEVNPQ